ncbi:MAG TPA: nucleoside triphosphate pyrophosphohydrolase [Candidatus Limnocylindrales bacterium]|nr:nucleoside triphosphate pyrophosphohydrolase [Candidatus Limnocylindrales bacterium]
MLDALVAEARLRWGLDLAGGLQVVPTEELVGSPVEPSRPVVLVPRALLRLGTRDGAPRPLPGRHGPRGRDPLELLRRLYPADHPVGRFGVADGTTVGALGTDDLRGALYLAPLAPERAVASPWAMPWISDRLRAPDGCPWDREQTHRSLRHHLLEEAYEVYDALEAGATPGLADELGDLLLQVVLHAQLAAEAGVFDLTDVQAAIGSKIVRRHPHVFGDAVARTAGDVNRQWERLKAAEREAAAGDEGGEGEVGSPAGALDGISRSLPALAASQEMQERAAHLGYDWPSVEGVLAKVREELDELARTTTPDERRDEVGDLLMVVVNLARKHGVEAEAALRAANEKFRRRFRIVEQEAAARGVALRDLTFAELDELWERAKAVTEAAGPAGEGASGEARR